MNWADYVILAILVFSAIMSLVRGFVREALSLATWIGAFVVAVVFTSRISRLLHPYVTVTQIRLVLSFAALFAATLLAGAIISHFAALAIDRTGLGRADRSVGFVFGVLRGYLAVAALVMLAGFTHLPRHRWWHQSLLIPYAQPVAHWLRHYVPTRTE